MAQMQIALQSPAGWHRAGTVAAAAPAKAARGVAAHAGTTDMAVHLLSG